MFEDGGDAVAVQGHQALVGLAQVGQVQGEGELAVAEEVGYGRIGHVGLGLGHAAQAQLLVAVDDEEVDRAAALELEGHAAGLLEIGGDEDGDGGHLAQETGDRGGIVASGQHFLPGAVELDEGATDVEVLEQEGADDVGGGQGNPYRFGTIGRYCRSGPCPRSNPDKIAATRNRRNPP